MMLLAQTREILAHLFSHAGPWLVVWVAMLIGVSAYIFHMARAPKLTRRWMVRKGECPFCGNVLFGTTHNFQRLYPLDPMSPENQYLCTGCDKQKIIGLLSLHEGGR
jgi:hypothetical protein